MGSPHGRHRLFPAQAQGQQETSTESRGPLDSRPSISKGGNGVPFCVLVQRGEIAKPGDFADKWAWNRNEKPKKGKPRNTRKRFYKFAKWCVETFDDVEKDDAKAKYYLLLALEGNVVWAAKALSALHDNNASEFYDVKLGQNYLTLFQNSRF